MLQTSIARCLAPLVVSMTVAIPAAVLVSYATSASTPPIRAADLAGAGSLQPSSPNLVPGIRDPRIAPATQIELADDEPVVGVSVGGRHRAYCLAALSPMQCHVVNDCIDGTPVTVTFCDRTDCARVFTGPGHNPLDVWTAGYMNGLMLRYRGQFFLQATARPVAATADAAEALPTLASVRTTWKDWRLTHPDTQVVGADSGRIKPLIPSGG